NESARLEVIRTHPRQLARPSARSCHVLRPARRQAGQAERHRLGTRRLPVPRRPQQKFQRVRDWRARYLALLFAVRRWRHGGLPHAFAWPGLPGSGARSDRGCPMNAVVNIEETARDAVCRLFRKELAEGYTLAGCHRYNRDDGSELFRVVRLKHPERDKIIKPMHRDGLRYRIGRPERPASGWPLYRPPYPLAETDPCIIVEGEACADALAKLGTSAATSGSATSANGANWTPLRDRHCLLWPDNDAPGSKYAGDVAAILRALGGTIEVIDVAALALPDKGDAVDWLAMHPDATAADVLALPRLAPAEPVDATPRV